MARTKRKINPVQPAPVLSTPQQRVYHTAGYVRLSIEDSGQPDADTIDMQRKLIQSYIEGQEDMQLYRVYCDNGWTGTNFDRPEFERMMEDVRTGKVDCIVVKDLSRFGRNYLEIGNYLEQIFPLLDVRFIAVNDHFDTLTAERSQDGYIIPLKNIINAAYSKDISRKVSPALAAMRQRGEFTGNWAAYGYQKCADDGHRIELDEETAPVVRDIFQWRLSGMSYRDIARTLEKHGIPSPSRYHYLKGDVKSERYANAKWSARIVSDILSNEVYLGHMVQGRMRSGLLEGRKKYQVPKSEWVIVRNTHEPLIDEVTFHAVQQMAEEISKAYKERLGRYDGLGKIPNILRGLIFCPDCGRPMTRLKKVTREGTNLYYVYICRTHAENPASCPKRYFYEVELKKILWETLRTEVALAGDLKRLLNQYRHSAKMTGQAAAAERERLAARQTLERAEMLYDSLYQSYVDELMTEQEYTELKQQYRSDMERAQARLDELDRQQRSEQRQTVENPWLTACGQFLEEEELTEEMAHSLIERVEISAENHVTVTLRYRDEYRALFQLLEPDGKAALV